MGGEATLNPLKEEQFRVLGEEAYGVRNGYPVAVTLVSRKKAQVHLTVDIPLLPEQMHAIQQEGSRQGLLLRCDHRQVFYEWKGPRDELLHGVDTTIGILQANRILPPQRCAICGEDAPNGAMLWGKHYDMVHSSCASQQRQNTERRERPSSFGKGVIGALLGAVVGIIPTILIAVLFQSIYGMLLMLFPVCSAYGYFKMGGRRDKKAMLICTLCSIAGLGLCLMCWDIYMNCNWMGMSVPEALVYTLQNMSFQGYWNYLFEEIGYLVIYGALGLVFMVQYIKGRLRTGERTAAERYATLVETDSGRTRVYTGSVGHGGQEEPSTGAEPERYAASTPAAASRGFGKGRTGDSKGWDPWD